jgi:outer membrane protein TolC
VASVQRKAAVGYTEPGELPRIQAELEARNQNVQSTSLGFVQKSDALALFLKLEPQVDLQFEIETRIPDPPSFATVDVETLRAYRTQEKKVKAASLSEKASESAARPELLFVGEATMKGQDASPGTSMSEATSGNFPIYYTGLQIGWYFGSGATSEKVAQSRASRMIEENKLERLRRDLRDQMEALQLKIKANHANALSSVRLRDLRQRVVNELTRTYAQGRTELRELIEAINLLSTAEVQYIRAIGDYQIALSEWSAFTDQLVTQKEAQ